MKLPQKRPRHPVPFPLKVEVKLGSFGRCEKVHSEKETCMSDIFKDPVGTGAVLVPYMILAYTMT